ncbi:MAG TPA: metallophosphoesterase, partial [Aminivibrio sp.]|nr:metallophosphoesterase [Aminivibrio sp.]
MKALYASDLHGRVNLYEEMIALASSSGVGVVILGGDLFPTVIPNPLALIGGSADFQEDLKGQFRFVEDYLVPAMRAFLEAHPGVRLVFTPGNHDWIPVVKRFGELLPEGLNIHGRTVSFDDVSVFGYACVIDSTFWVKDYARRDLRDDTYVASRFAIVSDTDRLKASPDGE